MKAAFPVLSVALSLALMATPALASSKKRDEAIEKAAQAEMAEGNNPHLPKLETASRAIGEKLDKFALAHLYTMREAYGVLEAVRIVRRDVDAAVKACGKDNPDLKAPMTDRFKSWTSAVDPVVKEKQALIDAGIKEQTYVKAKDINDYFALIRKTAEHANSSLEKRVITTPEACNGLLKSMDQTQGVVSELLSDIALLPWPPEEGDIKATSTPKTNN